MHQASFHRMGEFVKLVRERYQGKSIRVLDVGSLGVNGTYKELFRFDGVEYVGLDAEMGPNVDVVPKDAYDWTELEDASFDVIVSGQVLEHVEFPWLTVEQVAKKLKVDGLACLIAPSRGPEHRFPRDCYRYYPDGMRALVRWAGLTVIEVDYVKGASGFTDGSDQWGDCYGILTKKGNETSIRATMPAHSIPETPPLLMSRHTMSPLNLSKNASYFEFERQDVIEIISRQAIQAKRVLELGCSNGATGKVLKAFLKAEYYEGLDVSPDAVEKARLWLDTVQVVDIEKTPLEAIGLKKNDFDLLLGLDVFEHLYDPWETLVKFSDCLRPGGHAVLSIPNVGNIAVLDDLAKGEWHYTDAGLLDATHIRFFTLPGIQALVQGAGLQLIDQSVVSLPKPDMATIFEQGNSLRQGKLQLHDLSREDVIKLCAYQYIVTARKPG